MFADKTMVINIYNQMLRAAPPSSMPRRADTEIELDFIDFFNF